VRHSEPDQLPTVGIDDADGVVVAGPVDPTGRTSRAGRPPRSSAVMWATLMGASRLSAQRDGTWWPGTPLPAEAATVRQDLGLDQRLSTLGAVVPVGSAALGLMVWRDLDLTVVSPA
jgi:hypothetical protein